MHKIKWKEGDWAVYDLRIVQITEIREGSNCSVSDSSIQSSGHILDRCRPLTLRNKSIAEGFDFYYKELRNIRGSGGFNYPDISQYLSRLALQAMDSDNPKPFFEAGSDFVREARDYKPVIDGINLFRAV